MKYLKILEIEKDINESLMKLFSEDGENWVER